MLLLILIELKASSNLLILGPLASQSEPGFWIKLGWLIQSWPKPYTIFRDKAVFRFVFAG